LEMACLQRRPVAGAAIFHSDRGSQYASEDYGKVMKMYGLSDVNYSFPSTTTRFPYSRLNFFLSFSQLPLLLAGT